MVGEDWYKAKENWCNPERPFDPTRNVPPKQSVQSEMPRWKKDVVWGEHWQEPNNDPTQQDHYATTSFDTTFVDPDDWW